MVPHRLSPSLLILLLSLIWVTCEMLRYFYAHKQTQSIIGHHEEKHPDVPDRKPDRRDFAAVFLVCLWFVSLASWHLERPTYYVFDEVSYVYAAKNYLNGRFDDCFEHPPLAKLLMAAGIRLAGGQPATSQDRDNIQFALHNYYLDSSQSYSDTTMEHLAATSRDTITWRWMGVLVGMGCVLVVYCLGRAVSGSCIVATLSAFLFSLDGMLIANSRIAMIITYDVFFSILGVTSAIYYNKHAHRGWLICAGIAFGCAISTRWTAATTWLVIVIFLLYQSRSVPRAKTSIYEILGSLLILPFIVYGMTYVPYATQHGGGVQGLLEVVHLHGRMLNYHVNFKLAQSSASSCWSWPLVVRPVLYFQKYHNGLTENVWAVGNYVIWWLSIPALITLSSGCCRTPRPLLESHQQFYRLIGGLGLMLWLVWSLQPRTTIFAYYMLESIPYACIALGILGNELWFNSSDPALSGAESAAQARLPAIRKNALQMVRRRSIVVFVLVAAIAWLLIFYPLLTGWPVSENYSRLPQWLDRS